MFWFNMGPRGRTFGHRGFRPGVFLGMLLFLLCGGWVILAVLGVMFGAGVMVFGSVLSLFGRFLSHAVPALLSSRSFWAGLVIGLIWAVRNWKRNRAAKEEEEETLTKEKTREETEEPVIETQSYRFYG